MKTDKHNANEWSVYELLFNTTQVKDYVHMQMVPKQIILKLKCRRKYYLCLELIAVRGFFSPICQHFFWNIFTLNQYCLKQCFIDKKEKYKQNQKVWYFLYKRFSFYSKKKKKTNKDSSVTYISVLWNTLQAQYFDMEKKSNRPKRVKRSLSSNTQLSHSWDYE